MSKDVLNTTTQRAEETNLEPTASAQQAEEADFEPTTSAQQVEEANPEPTSTLLGESSLVPVAKSAESRQISTETRVESSQQVQVK
jgi:hypothetical protein